jgi:hypothetical protein
MHHHLPLSERPLVQWKKWQNKPLPQRRLKRNHLLDDEKWMNEELRNSFPFVTNKARLRALLRQNRLTPANIIQAKQRTN